MTTRKSYVSLDQKPLTPREWKSHLNDATQSDFHEWSRITATVAKLEEYERAVFEIRRELYNLLQTDQLTTDTYNAVTSVVTKALRLAERDE